MARVCELSGKRTVAGKSRSHVKGSAGGRAGTWSRKAQATSRTFRPNLFKVQVIDTDGKKKKMTLAASTIKRMKKFGHYKGVTLANAA